jgi:uncharacterized membrane protein
MNRFASVFLLSIALFLSIVSSAAAGIFMCNETSQKVFVAIGYMQGGHWVSRGWFSFQPTECDSLLLGQLENSNVYYFANSEGWESIWGGDKDGDAGYFCTSDARFSTTATQTIVKVSDSRN